MAQHNNLGKHGELAVISYLQKNGYRILESNWFYEKYEVDIIAENDQWIIFVEVKTRTSSIWGNPEDAVSSAKIRRIVEAADNYLNEKNIEKPVRFDVAAVISANRQFDIEYIEDAFFPPIM